jgi:hypothetical protein
VPAPFGVLFGISTGVLFAWLARAELAREERPLVTTPAFSIVCGFAALVYAPVAAYFAAFHGDWTWLYLVPAARIPSAVDLALVFFTAAMVPLAFALAAPAAVARNSARLVVAGGGPVALALIHALAGVRRLGTSGSYAQLHGGFGAEPIGASALGRAVLIAWIALGLGASWAAYRLRGDAGR